MWVQGSIVQRVKEGVFPHLPLQAFKCDECYLKVISSISLWGLMRGLDERLGTLWGVIGAGGVNWEAVKVGFWQRKKRRF